MTEAEWLACEDPRAMLGLCSRGKTRGQSGARKLRLLFVAAARASEIDKPDFEHLLAAAEGYADGGAEEAFRAARSEWYRAFMTPGGRERAAQVQALQAPLLDQELMSAGSICMLRCWGALRRLAAAPLATFFRDIFGNPFRPVAFSPSWRTDTAMALARTMYESREFGAMPILADALQDAGCDNDDILNHCRGEGPHVRGCWVVDLVLGKS